MHVGPRLAFFSRWKVVFLLIFAVYRCKALTESRFSVNTYALQEPECTSKETNVTCFGEGTLLPDHVQNSGAFGTYTHAIVEEGITCLGTSVFYMCYKLCYIDLPSTVIEYQTLAFQSCSLTTFTVGKNVETLIATVWNNCKLLTHIYVEDGSSHYASKDGFLFNGTSTTDELLFVGPGRASGGTLTLPSCRTLLTYAARWNLCTSIVISDDTTNIESYAFYACKQMVTIVLGKKVSVVDYRAFVLCDSLADFDINGNSNFYFSDNRFGLKNGNDHTSILWVGDNVTSLEIPSTVTSLGQSTLQSRSTLTKVTVASGSTTYKTACNDQLVIDKKDGAWKRARACVGGAVSIEIPSTVTIIQTACFRECPLLMNITFHDGNINILNNVLRGCSSLTTIDFQGCSVTNIDGDKSIANHFARDCASLVTISNWPTHNFVIGEGSFYSCGLKSLTIPNQCTEIVSYGFQSCKQLKSVTISNRMTSIGTYAFAECKKLETITFATVSVLQTIASWAFASCTSLETITLPWTVTTLTASCFASSKKLKSIQFNYNNGTFRSDGIAVYKKSGTNEYHTFVICPAGASSITFNANTKAIAGHAFHACEIITEITINEGITKIESCTIIDCSAIEVVRLPGSVTELKPNAIYSCQNLKLVTYCSNSDEITYDGDPFPNNPSIYIMDSFPRDADTCSFCGHKCKPILDLECNIPTSRFTSTVVAPRLSMACIAGLFYVMPIC